MILIPKQRLWRRRMAPFVVLVVCFFGSMACNRGGPPQGMSADPEPVQSAAPVPGGSAVQTGSPTPPAPGATTASHSEMTGAAATAALAGKKAVAPEKAAAPKHAVASAELPAAVKAKAAQVYAQRCVLCHGPHGQGNGVAAENLQPKPRNLQDPAWQAATADADIRAIIVQGGAGVGRSMMMPANPDLATKEASTLDGLVAIIRSFRN